MVQWVGGGDLSDASIDVFPEAPIVFNLYLIETSIILITPSPFYPHQYFIVNSSKLLFFFFFSSKLHLFFLIKTSSVYPPRNFLFLTSSKPHRSISRINPFTAIYLLCLTNFSSSDFQSLSFLFLPNSRSDFLGLCFWWPSMTWWSSILFFCFLTGA